MFCRALWVIGCSDQWVRHAARRPPPGPLVSTVPCPRPWLPEQSVLDGASPTSVADQAPWASRQSPRGDSTSMQIRSLGSLALFVSLHVQIITSFFFPESSKQQRRVTPLSAQRYTICSLSLCLSSPARQALRSWLILDTSNACSRISVYSAIPAVLKKHSPSSVCWSVKYLFPRISQFAVWFKLLLTTMMLKKKDFTKYRRFDNIFSYLQVRSLKWDVNAWPSSASECSHVVVFYQCHNVGSFISFHSPTDGNGIPPGSRECKAKGSDNYNRWVDVFLQYKIKMQR